VFYCRKVVIAVKYNYEEYRMKILVDGDACPVKENISEVSARYKIKVIIFISTAHWTVNREDVEYITVDSNYQEVDMKIVNQVKSGDIVITNDYGLASLVLAKRASAISFDGRVFTRDKIDYLLAKRHLAAKLRRQGSYISKQSKYSKEDREKFEVNLIELITQLG
jgi:hypothetical protein